MASVSMGVADLATDCISYARLRSGDVALANEGLKTPYIAILCFGAVTTAVSVVYRLRNGWVVRARMLELAQQGWKVNASATWRQAQQHDWELTQIHRTKVVLSLALLSVAMQGEVCTAPRHERA